ncbi:MAG: DUF916 domain-containing protein [Candidatus Saccharimonadales bacterium]
MIMAVLMTFAIIAILTGLHSVAAIEINTANTLKVSPVRTDIEIKPGENKTVKTTVTNLTSLPITVSPIENDFVSGDERGTPSLILDANTYAPTHSLKRFMTPLPSVTIPPKQAKTINVVITVPLSAQAGGYFGAIRFAPTSPDGGGQVNLSASVASLILLSVPGNTVEKLALTNFDIQQNGMTGSNFSSLDNLQATVRFENKGNIQIGPFGKVSVKQGDKVVYDTDFNTKDPRDVILPDGARRWDIPLSNTGGFGQYTVIATFTYGKNNQTIEVSKSFWVIPQSLIIAAGIGIIIFIGIIIIIWLFIRKRRSRRHRHYRP